MSLRTENNRKRVGSSYSRPIVSVYGSVIGLTAAGTSGVPESGSGSTNKIKP